MPIWDAKNNMQVPREMGDSCRHLKFSRCQAACHLNLCLCSVVKAALLTPDTYALLRQSSCAVMPHLLQIFVAQLDSEQQLPRSIEVTEYPAGQDIGFI